MYTIVIILFIVFIVVLNILNSYITAMYVFVLKYVIYVLKWNKHILYGYEKHYFTKPYL